MKEASNLDMTFGDFVKVYEKDMRPKFKEYLEENRELRMIATDFGRVKAVVGKEQVNTAIDRARQQEQIEAEQKRAAKRKHSREAR